MDGVFPGGSVIKSLSNRKCGSITRWGRSPGEGNGYPLQDSSLENPKGRGAWRDVQSMESKTVRHDLATKTPPTTKHGWTQSMSY